MDFSATLEPPGFTTKIHGTQFQLRDGVSRKLDMRGHLVVTTQANVKLSRLRDGSWCRSLTRRRAESRAKGFGVPVTFLGSEDGPLSAS